MKQVMMIFGLLFTTTAFAKKCDFDGIFNYQGNEYIRLDANEDCSVIVKQRSVHYQQVAQDQGSERVTILPWHRATKRQGAYCSYKIFKFNHKIFETRSCRARRNSPAYTEKFIYSLAGESIMIVTTESLDAKGKASRYQYVFNRVPRESAD